MKRACTGKMLDVYSKYAFVELSYKEPQTLEIQFEAGTMDKKPIHFEIMSKEIVLGLRDALNFFYEQGELQKFETIE
jgi:hypothetical protein